MVSSINAYIIIYVTFPNILLIIGGQINPMAGGETYFANNVPNLQIYLSFYCSTHLNMFISEVCISEPFPVYELDTKISKQCSEI